MTSCQHETYKINHTLCGSMAKQENSLVKQVKQDNGLQDETGSQTRVIPFSLRTLPPPTPPIEGLYI